MEDALLRILCGHRSVIAVNSIFQPRIDSNGLERGDYGCCGVCGAIAPNI